MPDRDDHPRWWTESVRVGPLELPRATVVVAALVAVVVLLVVAAAPAMGYGRPVNQLPLSDVDRDLPLEQPDDDGWAEVERTRVPLAPAESGVPRADETTVDRVGVESAHDGERLYVRLTWTDEAPSTETDDPRAFGDGVALQFPTDDERQPPIAMGSEDSPVNVWYWRADVGTQDLVAGGAGSTSHNGARLVEAIGHHEDGQWRVVFVREVDVDEPGHAQIRGEDDLSVAVGVWNGTNMERAGRKSVSEWHHYPMGPGPFTPPWETILWTVAGLAVVGVLIVTIYGVRRASGEVETA